jgi:hypothetical protein
LSHFESHLCYEKYSHCATSAGLKDEFATNTLGELAVHTGIVASVARAVRGEGLELVTV